MPAFFENFLSDVDLFAHFIQLTNILGKIMQIIITLIFAILEK